MIKAIARGKDGNLVVILGIDLENVRRLVNGDPLVVHGADLMEGGFPSNIDICVTYGDTLAEILQEMRVAGFEVPNEL